MKRIIYQVLPRLWGNGRFSAWDDAAFSYLKSLGVDYLWLTGVPRHACGEDFTKGDPGSPYAVCDWFDINPYLADIEGERVSEFKSLVSRAHNAGIRVMTDFIPNHVAKNYHGPLPVLPYCDFDWTDTLKLDYSDPDIIGLMSDVLSFWASLGVDGFRCDMVELVDAAKLGAITASVRKKYPDLIFMAEVYVKERYREYLDVAGFDLLYDKSGIYDILRSIVSGFCSAEELTWNWQRLQDMQPRMVNFLENHDEQRLCSRFFASSPDRTYAALSAALLFNTASFLLYAGQELGEDASESGDGRTSIFNWVTVGSIAELNGYLNSGKSLSEHASSVLARYRTLLELSRRPVFSCGNVWDLCYCNLGVEGFDARRHFAFVRYDGNEAWLVFCNFSDTRIELRLVIPSDISAYCGCDSASVCAEAWDASVIRLI